MIEQAALANLEVFSEQSAIATKEPAQELDEAQRLERQLEAAKAHLKEVGDRFYSQMQLLANLKRQIK